MRHLIVIIVQARGLAVREEFAAGTGQAKVGNIRLLSGTGDINTIQGSSKCGG